MPLFFLESDYTDDTDILGLECCREEELPESEKVLKLIRDVRCGKLDFIALLRWFSPNNLEKLMHSCYGEQQGGCE